MTADFHRVVRDFTHDLLRVFPERADTLDPLLQSIATDAENSAESATQVKAHCINVLPQRFFDILYQNNSIFEKKEDGTYGNTEFLPGLNFHELWNVEGVTDATKTTIWKYLQLIMFAVVEDVSNKESFGDTANLFEAIDENELKTKLEETVQHMQTLFEEHKSDEEEGDQESDDAPEPSEEDKERAQSLHEHISGMLDGKLGKLAKEIAADAATELGFDEEKMSDTSSVQGVFQKLFQNPGKLMGLVKNIGGKLDAKIKSGEIKESEILQEASSLMSKMKEMPGMGDMQSLLGKMGMGGKGKVNMSAFQNHMQSNIKHAQTKERMQAKLAARRAATQQGKSSTSVFSTGETVERTPVTAVHPSSEDGEPVKKKKKKRSKKGKKKGDDQVDTEAAAAESLRE
jgi:hypothetical protein